MNDTSHGPQSGAYVAKFPWRGVFGAVLMFGAFVFQFKIATDLSRKHLELDQAELAIETQLLRLETWARAYNEQLDRDAEDKRQLGYCAAKALQAHTQIEFYSNRRIESDEKIRQEIRVSRSGLLEKYRQWLKKEQWDLIIRDFTSWVRSDDIEKSSDQISFIFIQRKLHIVEAETRWTTVFFILYVIGTLLIASQYRSDRTRKLGSTV